MVILKRVLNSETTYVVLIAVVLCTLLMGYAFGSISLAVFVIISIANVTINRPKFIKSYLPMIGLFLLMFGSLFWSIDLQKSIRGLSKSIPLAAVPLAFMCIPRLSKKSINSIFEYVSISNSIFAIIFFIDASLKFKKSQDNSVFFYHNLVSRFDLNAIYVSSFFLLSFGYLMLKKTLNKLDIFKAIILFVVVIFLSSKLIIFLLLLITLIRFLKLKLRPIIKGAILILFLTSTFFALQKSYIKQRVNDELNINVLEVLDRNNFSGVYPWSGTTIRLFQIRLFTELYSEDNILFTGYGVNAAQGKLIERQKKYKLYDGFKTYNFHNQYVQIFSEVGIFGFILLVIALYVLFKEYLNKKNKMVLVTFLLFSSLFFTESYLSTQRGIIHFIIYFCLISYPHAEFDN